MTKGADNDNVLSSVVAQSQDEGNWPTYGPGSTALATDPKAPSASSDSDQEADDEDFSGIDLSAPEEPKEPPPPPPPPVVETVSEVEAQSSQSPVDIGSLAVEEPFAEEESLAQEETPAEEEARSDEAMADVAPVENDSGGVEAVAKPHPDGADFGVSDAVPLETLGFEPPHRPAPQSTALQVYNDLRAQEIALARSQRVVGSANPHLFNIQPDLKASVEAGTQKAFAAVPPSTGPLTSQPGFLAGLIAAAVIGAGLYAYLV